MPVYIYYRNLEKIQLICQGTIGGQMNPNLLIGKKLSFLGFPMTPKHFENLVLVKWAQSLDELLLVFQLPQGVEESEDLSTA